MPKPVYMICSKSGAIDEKTKSISFFDVLEEQKITKIRQQESKGDAAQVVQLKPLIMMTVAVWLREDGDDPEQDFQAQFVCHMPKESPEEPHEFLFASTDFRFKNIFHRIITREVSLLGFFGPGMLWVECRIRRAGEAEWIARQRFPIVLVAHEPSAKERESASRSE